MKNSKTLAIILITVIVLAGLFLVYYFFIRDEESGSLVGSGLITESMQGEGELAPLTDFNSLSSQKGRELLLLLDELNSISFDTGFIEGRAFGELEDYSRELEPQEPGRENPFAPLQ